MGQSRNENILENILGAQNPLGEPQSREEALLMQILEQGMGSSTLADLKDINIENPTDGQTLKYNPISQKWENGTIEGDVILDNSASGAIASFISTGELPLKDCKCTITPTLTGATGLTLNVCGVNLFDKTTVTNGYLINGSGNQVSYAGWNISDFIPVPEGASLYLNGLTTHPNTNQDNYMLFDASKTKIGYANVSTSQYPWTVPAGTKYVKFSLNDSDLNTAQFSPTTDTTYHAYNGATYPVTWQSEAGTVYGGEIDLTTGVLTVTHYHGNLGDYSWNYDSTNQRFATGTINPPAKAMPSGSPADYLCEIYECKPYGVNSSYSGEDNIFYLHASGYLRIIDTSFNGDVDAFTTAVSGKYIVYPLATPVTYQIDPVAVRALVGGNNVFTEVGNTSVEYYTSTANNIKEFVETQVKYWTDIDGTLEEGQTSITLTDSAITTSSTIEVFNDLDIPYVSKTVSTGSITLTFDEQDSDMVVKVRVS